MFGRHHSGSTRGSGLYRSFALLFVILVVTTSLVLAATDYYKVLGVDKRASERDIKRAYRKRAQKIHPDKHPDKHQEFIELSDAYQALSDPETRKIYDRQGVEGVKKHQAQKDNPHQQHHDPFDIFSRFFGGGGGGHAVRRGPSKAFNVEASLKDFYNGKTFTLEYERHVLCSHCDGSGAESPAHIHTCETCQGHGVRIVRQQIMPGFVTNAQMTCDVCGGGGTTIAKKCHQCKGAKILREEAKVEVEIERGAPDGKEYIIEGESDEGPEFEAGDVIVRVHSNAQGGKFRRQGSSLHMTLPISLSEALLGFHRNITHLDGRVFTVRRDGVTQPGFVSTIDDEGMPIAGTMISDASDEATRLGRDMLFGKLYIQWEVVFPESIDDKLRSSLETLFGKPDLGPAPARGKPSAHSEL
ncbi:DnaJ-related protein scj1 [Thecaphora frezii]